jgi:hypothetical protein
MGKGGAENDPKMYIAVLIVGSLVEMWAACATCDKLNDLDFADKCKKEYAFAVAVGCISLFICLVMSILFCVNAGTAQTASPIVAVVMFILWGLGIGVCTFSIPFMAAGGFGAGGNSANGYFSTWICFITSCLYVQTVPQVQQAAQKAGNSASTPVMVTFFAGICEMWAAAYACDNFNGGYVSVSCGKAGCSYDTCTDLEGWGVAVGSISSIITLVIIIMGAMGKSVPDMAGKICAALVFLLWAAGVATLTFDYRKKGEKGDVYGLFTTAGNGYFGTWCAFFSSFVWAYMALFGGGGGGGGGGGAAPKSNPQSSV